MAPKQKKSNMAQKLSIVAVSVLIVTIVIMSYKLCPSTSCVTGAAAGTYEYFFNDSQSQGDNGQGAGTGGQGTGPSGATISATPTPEDPDLSAGYFCANGLPDGPIDCNFKDRCFYHSNSEGEYECSDNACSSVFTTGPESWGANCWGIPWCCDSSGGLMSHGIHMGLYCQGLFGIAHPDYEYFNADCASCSDYGQVVTCPGFEMKGSAVTAADCVCASPPCNTSDFNFSDSYFAGETETPQLAGSRDIAKDSAGNLYILAQTDYNSFTVYKYGEDCDLIQQFCNYNNATYEINVTGIAVDGGKNVFVSGTVYNLGGHEQQLSASDFDYLVVKCNSSGSVERIATYPGGSLAVAMDIATGNNMNNVYVTGFNGTVAGTKALTIKYDRNLTVQCIAEYDGLNGFDKGLGLTDDRNAAGSEMIYVAGSTGNSLDWADDSNDAILIAYNTACAAQWNATYAGAPGFSDLFEGVSLSHEADGRNYAYATGLTAVASGAADTNVLLVKYNATGSQVASATYDGPGTFAGNDWDQGNSVMNDIAGNAYVAATVTASDGTTDWAVLGYNGSLGLFSQSVTSMSDGNDEALALVTAPIYVTGIVNGTRGFLGPTGPGNTLRYSQPSGAPQLASHVIIGEGLATKLFGVRYRAFGNKVGDGKMYLGINDMGNPLNRQQIGSGKLWPATSSIPLTYDKTSDTLTASVTTMGSATYPTPPTTLSQALLLRQAPTGSTGNGFGSAYAPGDANTITLGIRGTATSALRFANVSINVTTNGVTSTIPLQDFVSDPSGSYNTYTILPQQLDSDSDGYTEGCDLELSGTGKVEVTGNLVVSGNPLVTCGSETCKLEYKFGWDPRIDCRQYDCAPGNAAINPGAEELCDGIDNDCDGAEDECLGVVTCGVGACESSILACVNGVEQTAEDCVPGDPGIETCNGLDDDCDNLTDEGFGTEACGTGLCTRTVDVCEGGVPQECVPGDPIPEVCGDGIDQDCNGADLRCPTTGGGGGTTVIIEAPLLGPPGDPVISTDREAVLTEPETILVFDSNGNPAEGFLVLKAPNGTSISVPIVDGKVQFDFETAGTWSLEYTDPATSKTAINYIEALAAPMQPQPPQPQPAEVPAPPAKPPVVKDDTMLMALLLGLLVIACIGAFLAYRKHKGKH